MTDALPNQISFFDNDKPEFPELDGNVEEFVKPGEVWIIGDRHRLLCGDTGRMPDVGRLMNGKRAHMIHTDPPYNVAVRVRSKKKGQARVREIKNDNIPDEEFEKKLSSWFWNMQEALLPGGAFYFWGGYSNCEKFPGMIRRVGLHFAQAIIWVKNTSVFGRRDFRGKHEWCFYGWKQRDGYPHYFSASAKGIQADVWTFKTVNAKFSIHLTEKPVEIPKLAIECSTQPGELVLDPFAGSGSTLIAAEVTDRTCYIMEIDSWYASLILDRCKRLGLKIKKEG